MEPKAALIVLNWNRWSDTVECLRSLQRLTYPSYQIVVVDNGSAAASTEDFRTWARSEFEMAEYTQAEAEAGGVAVRESKLEGKSPSQRLVLIRLEKNLGFSAGNNVAIRYALRWGYSHIGLLNNDTVVDPDFLAHLMDALGDSKPWSAASPKILYQDEPNRIWYAGAELRLWRANAVHQGLGETDGPAWSGIRRTGHLSGCAFLARRSWFEALGFLDEDLFFGQEDIALSCKARGLGLPLCVHLDAKVYHRCGGTAGRGHPLYTYYFNKNRLVVLTKHGTFPEKIAGFSFYALTRLMKFPFRALTGKAQGRAAVAAELKAIRDFLLGRWGSHDREVAGTGMHPL